jgi:predicted dehydrogenase
MRFGVGVIGATGFIGTPYRREIREAKDDATIVALCARRRDRLEAAAKEDGAGFITDDWREVVEHPDVDFVVVATPDALHHEAVMACAKQRKHVLCEKPVGMNVQQAYEMWAAYRDAGLGHYVPYWTRYVEVFGRARRIVAKGTLGEIKAVIYRWHNPRPAAMPFTWRDNAELSAAGSIADVGSHAYDTVRRTIGEEARRVLTHADVITPAKPSIGEPSLDEALAWGRAHSVADRASLRKGTTFDYASISVEFQSGAVGSIILSHASFLRRGLAPELELHGTEASLGVDRMTGTVTLARRDKDPQVLERVPNRGFGNRFAQHVFPAIRERAAGSPSEHPGLDDGWRVQIFADAAAISAARGTWVELAELDVRSG